MVKLKFGEILSHASYLIATFRTLIFSNAGSATIQGIQIHIITNLSPMHILAAFISVDDIDNCFTLTRGMIKN